MKRLYLFVFFILSFFSVVTFGLAVDINSCQAIYSNEYYRLISDILVNDVACFYSIPSDVENIVLDLNGHTVYLNGSNSIFLGVASSTAGSIKYVKIINGSIFVNGGIVFRNGNQMSEIILKNVNISGQGRLVHIAGDHIYMYNVSIYGVNIGTPSEPVANYIYGSRLKVYNLSIAGNNVRLCYDEKNNVITSGDVIMYPCTEFDHIYKTPTSVDIGYNSRTFFTDNYVHIFYINGNDIIARRYAKDLSQYYEEYTFSNIFGSVTPSIDNWDVAWRSEINKIVLAVASNYGTAVCFIDEEYDNVVCHTTFNYSTVTIGNVENSILSVVGYNQTSPPSIFITRFNVSSIPASSVAVSELELPASYIQLFYKPYVLYNGTHYYLFTIANNDVPGFVGSRFLYLHIYDNDLNWVESKCAPAWNCYTEVHGFFAYEYPWTDDYGLVTINYDTNDIYRWVFTKKELFEEARSRLAIPFNPELITGPADYKSVERFSTYLPYFKYVEPETAIPPYVTIYLIPEALYGNFSYSSVFAMTYEVGNNGGEDITVNVSVSNPTWMQIQSNMYMYKATINEYHPGWFVASIQPSGYVDFIVNFTVPKLSPAVIGHNVTEHIFASYDSSQISSLINVYIYGPSSLSCGNGVCEPGESYINCPLDCYGNESFVCGNGICEAGESYDNCPIDCPISQYPSIPPTPPTPPTPPAPPAYNITQPLAGINVTALQASGYGWLVPFLTPLFIAIGGIIGVAAAVEYYIRTGGIAFCLSIIALSLGLWYLGFLPMVVAILITIMAGLFLWYLASRLVRR